MPIAFIFLISSLIPSAVFSQSAATGPLKLSYYVFGTKTGVEEYSKQTVGGITTYSATVKSTYINKIDKTLQVSFNNSNELKSSVVHGSSYSWFDSTAQGMQVRKNALKEIVSEPLPVSLLGLFVKQYRGTQQGVAEKNGFTIFFHGPDKLNGITGRLNCYSVSDLTWGHCFVWVNSNFEVKAAVCPLVAYTIYAVDEKSASALPSLESAYAKRSMEFYQKQIQLVSRQAITAITHVQLWDGSSNIIQKDMTVVFSEKQVIAVIPTAAFKMKNVFVIDGTGKTIIPGLWDMHMHVKQTEWLPASLAAGITYVRDMGNNYNYIKTLSALSNMHKAASPYIFKAGWIDARGNFPFEYSGMQANTREAAGEWVNKYYRDGFGQIKIWENTSREITTAIIGAAHQKGMEVVGHVPQAFSFSQIMEAGINEISHLSEIVYGYKDDSIYNSTPKVVSLFKKHQVRIDPTFVVLDIGWRNKNKPLSEIEPGASCANKYVLNVWQAFGVDSARNATRGGEVMKDEGDMIVALYRAGVPVVAGADGGIPGHSLHRELELYVRAGLTPMEAIRTATVIPAGILLKHPDKYLIKKGNEPNFILLNGDPFDNISNIRKVRYTVVKGKILESKALWEMVGFRPSVYK